MIKGYKRVASILMALAMVTSVGASQGVINASAVDVDIEGMNPDLHKFSAYQVIKGTVEDEIVGVESWGNGIDVEMLINDLKFDDLIGDYFWNCEEDNVWQYAEVFASFEDESKESDRLAEIIASHTLYDNAITGTTKLEGLEEGYYLIIDNDALWDNPDDYNTNTGRFLRAIGSETTEIKPKSALPTCEKKVYDAEYRSNDEEMSKYSCSSEIIGDGNGWCDIADYNLNDNVRFRIYGTVASNYDRYDSYYYEFSDEFNGGLWNTELTESNIHIWIDKTEITQWKLEDKYKDKYHIEYTTTTVNGREYCTGFSLIFDDLKEVDLVKADSEIVIEYELQLAKGQSFEADYMDPYENEDVRDGYMIVTGNGYRDSTQMQGNENKVHIVYSNNPGNSEEKGETPDDEVTVLTYELEIDKYDEEMMSLQGAKFYLQNANDEYIALEYEERDQCYYVIGKTYEQYDEVIFEGGIATIRGLEDGKYKLTEVEAPSGHSKLENSIEFNIVSYVPNSAEEVGRMQICNSEGEWIDVDGYKALPYIEIVVEGENGVTAESGEILPGRVHLGVMNRKVSVELPETGGIGTTLCYTVGGFLSVMALAFLITKKRFKEEDM